MKLVFVLITFLSAAAFAQDAFYKEHCENKITAVNLKTGETYSGDQTKISFGSDNIEWTDGNLNFRITLQDATLSEGTFPMIQQTLRTLEKTSEPNQTIAKIAVKDFKLLDYKVKTHSLTSKILVTALSPTESTATDIGSGETQLPDQRIVTAPGTMGATTTTHTQLHPSISGDLRIDSSVTVCTDTPVKAKDIVYQGFYTGAKAPIETFTKQHSATMTAKKSLIDCQAKPDPKDCTAFDKKYQASAKNRESIWATLIRADKLPIPKRPRDDGGSVVVVPNGNCSWNSECQNGEACINHVCQRGQCSRRSDCAPWESCVNGSCSGAVGGGCSSGVECLGTEQCIRGVCTDDTSRGGCREDSDCQSGRTCSSRNICE